jgi:pyrroloquinoline-quinone synthase
VSNNSWFDEVLSVLEAKSLLKHPFYQAWNEGTLTTEDLKFYAQQYYGQESRFPRYVSAVHSNCPELKVRQVLLDNIAHEESGADNHPELWLRFAGEVGASRESVTNAKLEKGTKDCVESFEKLTRDANWVKGIAALYAYEAQQPAVAKTKIDGLKKWYNVSSRDGLSFFEVHQDVDVWHSESEKQILLDQAARNPDLKSEIVAAVSEACDALNGLLTGVCEARGIRCEMQAAA